MPSKPIHAANGFLVNQFWWFLGDKDDDDTAEKSQAVQRDQLMKSGADDSGSLEILCRFATDVVAAVVDEVGVHRVGVRLSPFTEYVDGTDVDPEAHALHLIHFMDKLGVLYCHVVEPRMCANGEDGKLAIPHRLLPFRKAFRGTFIVNGGYDRDEGDKVVSEGYADLVSYGRLFLANPDLPERFMRNAGLNKYDRSTFYTSDPAVGYTDYPFLEQEIGVAG
uniref:Uncharacterized protein n=1 Tax=Avena sativa TaxID=4498 RepID=A0ACD5YNU8_AVESA